MLVHDTHNTVYTEMAPELGRRDQLPPYEQIWTIAKILANSQRIANLQRGSTCRSEKRPTGEPYKLAV